MRPLLHGIAASVGVTRGKVKVISQPSDHLKMEKGDILVAEFTTPLFLPAILKASAIVTDIGGILCHAAIVAREYRIPCIVGTGNATKVLHDGQEVQVDGSTGILYG